MYRIIWVIILLLFGCSQPQIPTQEQAEVPKWSLPPSLPISNVERTASSVWQLVSFPISVATDLQDMFVTGSQFEHIKSVWKWDQQSNDWLVYPQHPDFSLLTVVTPNDGYWIKASRDFALTGSGISQNTYEFVQGWNLIGYSHSTSSITVSDFFSNGDFWQDSCGEGEPVISVWRWENNTWKLYFPDDADRVQFNTDQGTNFEALTILDPGMGVWVNVNRNNSPEPSEGCGMPSLNNVSLSFGSESEVIPFNQDGALSSTPELATATPSFDFSITPKSVGTAQPATTGDITFSIQCPIFDYNNAAENENTYCNFGFISLKLLDIIYEDNGTETSLTHPEAPPHDNGKFRVNFITGGSETIIEVYNYEPNIEAAEISGQQIKIDINQLVLMITKLFPPAAMPLFTNGSYNFTLELSDNIPLDVYRYTGTFSVQTN